MKILLIFFFFLTYLDRVWPLSCIPCREITCELPPRLFSCNWGLALDMCGCCYVCAKGEGEKCGGQWGWHGRCGRGLYCRVAPTPTTHSRPHTVYDNTGTCVRPNDTIGDKISNLLTWISSLFRNAVTGV
ncbi:single insulin-like growth factor-binding domain protein-2 [Palaemon carinicauda]|uniref:single insulin-like growth factor-binding domain protein-2 n=1 Tax=Palaemon carinicauda TaxID=392227 RepID=UPI0035B57144